MKHVRGDKEVEPTRISRNLSMRSQRNGRWTCQRKAPKVVVGYRSMAGAARFTVLRMRRWQSSLVDTCWAHINVVARQLVASALNIARPTTTNYNP